MAKEPNTREPMPLPPKLVELENVIGEALGYVCGMVNMVKHPLRSYPYVELNAAVKKLEAIFPEVAHAFVVPAKPWALPKPFPPTAPPPGQPYSDPVLTTMACCVVVRDAFRIVVSEELAVTSPGMQRMECGPLEPKEIEKFLENSKLPFDELVKSRRVSADIRRLLTTPIPLKAVRKLKAVVHAHLVAIGKHWAGKFPPKGSITLPELVVIVGDHLGVKEERKLRKRWEARQRRSQHRYFPAQKGWKSGLGGTAKTYDAWELLVAVKEDIPSDQLPVIRQDVADFLRISE